MNSVYFEVEGIDLVADPIYRFINFTIPAKENPNEVTEEALINSAWIQRLRFIYQLQNVRWVYPAGEHTRFQHVLGSMHLGGRFGRRIYSSLEKVVRKCPSQNFIEEVLRIAGLVHDVGHGPFGHFFDHNFLLPKYRITHEDIGKEIIITKLGKDLKGIQRSPTGKFEKGEHINPNYIAYLIKKGGKHDKYPDWLRMLKPLLTGIYTIDNLDYVTRDSYMLGISEAPISVERLLHYSFFTKEGLTLHKKGIEALKMFLNLRSYLFSNAYFHRTVRALDRHLGEIFQKTMEIIVTEDPRKALDKYQRLTDHFLFGEVAAWKNASEQSKQNLAHDWEQLLNRETRWKMIAETYVALKQLPKLTAIENEESLYKKIKENLPAELKNNEFQVDIASQDPRPENLTAMGEEQLYVYDPESSPQVSQHKLKEYLEEIPSLVVQCRIYALNRQNEQALKQAFQNALGRAPSEVTSI